MLCERRVDSERINAQEARRFGKAAKIEQPNRFK
jgi:hypothetical protein